MPVIIQRLEANESLNSITTDLGIPIDTPRQMIHELRPGLIQPPKKRYIPDDVKRNAVREYMTGNDSLATVSERFGVGRQSLFRWVNAELGVIV